MSTGNSAATPTSALGTHSQGPPGTPLDPAPDTPMPLSPRMPLSHTPSPLTHTQAAIDHRFFPHIVDAIIAYAGQHPEGRWRLAQICRSLRARFGVDPGTHVAARQPRPLPRQVQMLLKDSWSSETAGAKFVVFDVYRLGNGVKWPGTASSTEPGSTPLSTTPSNLSSPLSALVTDMPFAHAATRTWLAESNMTILDLGAVDEVLGIRNVPIVRCQLLRRRNRVYAPVSIFLVDMNVETPTMEDVYLVNNTLIDTPKVVFVLRYAPTAIPAGPSIDATEVLSFSPTRTVVVHLVVRQSVQAPEEASEASEAAEAPAAKRENLERFNRLIAYFARSGATVTVVGLERVGATLFGVVASDLLAGPTGWERFSNQYFIDRPRPRGQIGFLDESEYMRQYDMTPLMLAVERGEDGKRKGKAAVKKGKGKAKK